MALLDFPLNNIIKIRSIKLRIRWYGEENERRAKEHENKLLENFLFSALRFQASPPSK